jgi:hypothetical protein
VRTTRQHANTASTLKAGLLASLRGLLHVKGSGAPKIPEGSGVPVLARSDADKLTLGNLIVDHLLNYPTTRSRTVSGGRPRPATRIALLLALVSGVFVFSAAPALAAGPPEVPVTIAGPVTATSAVFEGTLNPHSEATVGGYFAFSEPGGLTCAEGPLAGLEGFEGEQDVKAQTVHATVGLQPNKTYKFCLVAFNEGGAQVTPGNEATVETPAAPPTVQSEGASAVDSHEATLEAQINPNNEATNYTFEYSTSEASKQLTGTIVKINGAAALENFGAQTASASTSAVLAPGTTYYYHVVAENAQSKTEAKPVAGEVQSFTTPATPGTASVTAIAATTATFNGSLALNPVDTTYSFSYKVGTECTGESATPAADAGTGTGNTAVEATPVTGLLANTLYTVCFVTTNQYGTQTGPPVTFRTLPDASATEVTSTSAILHGTLNPEGGSTSYHFEYVPEAQFDESGFTNATSTPEATAEGSSPTPVEASIPGQLPDLTPGTTYHYRLVAERSGETFESEDETFTTQAAGNPPPLPDDRQYQLVSPAEKDGAQVFGITAENGVVLGGSSAVQASADGDGITYLASAPAVADPAGNATASQLLSRRQGAGWETQDISPKHEGPVQKHLEDGESFRFFSNTLSDGLLQEPTENRGAVTFSISLRNNETNTSQILPIKELPQPVEFEAATPDMNDLILSTGEEGGSGVYEWSHGVATEVNILEDEEPAPCAFLGGYKVQTGEPSEFAGRNAVSADGSRVVWGTSTALFSRDVVTKETVQLDKGPEGSGGGVFQLASSDGTRVFFTDATPLTPAALPNSLYMFNIPTRQLTDLGAAGIKVFTAGCQPCLGDEVLGADEAGTAVYVTSEAVLTGASNGAGETAAAGGGNIYLLRESPVGDGSWSAGFVATLSPSDEAGYNPDPEASKPQHLAHLPVRVSGDGEYLAFMSDRSLGFVSSGGVVKYDDRDAVSGEPDEEVYLYKASSTGTVCVSCDPTGARPVGELDTGAYPGSPMDPNREWKGHWLAAAIPPWNENRHSGLSGFELPLYASRVLSDSGRLFFDSVDALVPQDVNGKVDVYEYEPGGVGSCAVGGSNCVSLISSGTGTGNSEFVDASTSGDDVFFTTAQHLVAADTDPAVDMYDAHVCSAGTCMPASSVASPPCDSTDSCRAAEAVQPGVFGAPASQAFSGAGNLSPTVAAPVVKKALTRAQKLANALKTCKKDKARKKRAVCEAKARKSYGPLRKAKTKRGAKR